MNYNIVIYISRHNLSFYYSQNKSCYTSYNFENEQLIPLCFYSEGTDFSIGNSAKLKVQNNYPNSYEDYFELIKNTESTFKFFNSEKKYKYLLVVGIEYLINQFLKEILMSSDEIADIREELNLSFVFASDIKQNEINFIGDLYKESGYKHIRLIYFNYLMLNFLDKYRKIAAYRKDRGRVGAYKGYLIIDALNTNIYVDFYNEPCSKNPKFIDEREGLAIDPKDNIIAKMLFDLAVIKSGSLVEEQSELIRLLPLARKYSNTTKTEPLITVELSDGSVEKVRIKMRRVKEILSYESNFTRDFDAIKECEKKARVANIDLLVIVKRSITSIHLLDKMKSYFNHVYVFNEEIEDVFELFNSSIEIISGGNFLSQDVTGIDSGIEDVSDKPSNQPNTEIEEPQRPSPPPPPLRTGDIEKDKKDVKKNGVKRPPPPPTPSRTSVTKKDKKDVKKNGVKRPLPPPPPSSTSVTKKDKKDIKKNGVKRPPPPPPPSSTSVTKKDKKDVKKNGVKRPPPPPPPPKKKTSSKKKK